MQRRDFIKKGGAVSAALVVSSSVLGSISYGINTDRKINIGIIGTGVRGKGLLKTINTIDNMDVVACCDTIPFHLDESLKLTNGLAIGYSDYHELLKDKNVDAVLVTAPFYLHTQISIAALDAGKHVYCEKTLAKGYEGINTLVSKVKNSDRIFQVGHQYHSSRLYTHVVELLKEGKVGTISAFECQWNRHGDWRRSVSKPDLERQINWRMYKEYSGGLLAELSSHQIEFVNWVLDAHPEKVTGFGGVNYWKDGRETYDNIHVMYSYPDGVKASFICLTTNANEGYQIKVLGDKGTLLIDYDTAWFYPEGSKKIVNTDVDGVSGATAKFKYQNGEEIKVSHLDPSKQALVDFKTSILNNKQPESNVYTGARAAVCIQMGLDAMYNNEIVNWNPGFDI
ncbi:Gfo/Idh/MocA family oxidoreductase [Formosa sp. PL04]|uniref:Gfo/Idh/MocA family protein n=1 Tax=Formosa sp. PL04 TaxID=3081755 RepID=UPI002980E661|nr:Gfo/Idh/MocA family oxidoreductase [Formosa sp. PL04]MDW5288142.1 Gfo/Idh/MocA family oxidoreductase [Formosa sp. PL04]